MGKLINCKTCNAEIAASAKACPNCGAKIKKPFYTKWWVWIIAIIIIAAIGNQGKNDEVQQANIESDITASKIVESNKNNSKPEISPETTPEPTPEPKKEKKPDFEVIGDITSENNGFAIYIIGTIKNNKGRTLSYAQVTFNLYDEEGNQIGTAMDNINNFEKDGTWKFKAIGFETDAKSYKLVEITGF